MKNLSTFLLGVIDGVLTVGSCKHAACDTLTVFAYRIWECGDITRLWGEYAARAQVCIFYQVSGATQPFICLCGQVSGYVSKWLCIMSVYISVCMSTRTPACTVHCIYIMYIHCIYIYTAKPLFEPHGAVFFSPLTIVALY